MTQTTGLGDICMETRALTFWLVLLLTATSVNATSYAPVTLETLAEKADYVIEGKAVQKLRSDDGTFTTEILIESTHKGKLEFNRIKLTPFDVFDVGEIYLIFINKSNSSKYDNEFNITNGGLGYFPMENCLVIVAKQASGLLGIVEGDEYGLNEFLLKAALH